MRRRKPFFDAGPPPALPNDIVEQAAEPFNAERGRTGPNGRGRAGINRESIGDQSGITAVVSISTIAPGSIRPLTSITAIAG